MRKKYCVTFTTMTRQYYEHGWLGKYSKEKGISAFIKSEDDCYHSPSSWFDSPIEIGQEIKKAGNILIVGKTRNLEHMIRKLIVNPEKVSKPSYVSNDDEFIQEMSEHNEKDGADFFDCDKSCIYRVGLLKDRKGRKTFSNIR